MEIVYEEDVSCNVPINNQLSRSTFPSFNYPQEGPRQKQVYEILIYFEWIKH